VSVWVVREGAVLPVDLAGITKNGDTKTNHALKAGDQLFVQVESREVALRADTPSRKPRPTATVGRGVSVSAVDSSRLADAVHGPFTKPFSTAALNCPSQTPQITRTDADQ